MIREEEREEGEERSLELARHLMEEERREEEEQKKKEVQEKMERRRLRVPSSLGKENKAAKRWEVGITSGPWMILFCSFYDQL